MDKIVEPVSLEGPIAPRTLLFWAWLLIVLPLTGCGTAEEGRVDAEGEITYDGSPVDRGMIRFTPLDEGGEVAFAEFTAGRYELKGKYGVMPGEYRVEIDGYKKVKEPKAPDYSKDENGMIEKPILPEKYNSRSELTVDFVEGESKYDFHLKK